MAVNFMEIGVGLLIVAAIIYVLIVKGVIWKILVGIFAFLGMHSFLSSYSPITNMTINFGSSIVDMSIIIPIVVIILAAMYVSK